MFMVGRMGFALLHSQESRIMCTLQGAKKNLAQELGFMSKIKQEVSRIMIL